VPDPTLEILIETPYIELASFELNPSLPESKAAPEPEHMPVEIVPPPVYAPTMHVYSQGRITQLLAGANPEPQNPRAERMLANMRNDEGCTSHRTENTASGASCGGAIGLIMKATCGTSLLTAAGCAGLGAVALFCYNPPLLRDCFYPEAEPAPAPRL
jgi:hypothetical protein